MIGAGWERATYARSLSCKCFLTPWSAGSEAAYSSGPLFTSLLLPGTGTWAVIPGRGPSAYSVGPSLRSEDIICSQVVSGPVYAEMRPIIAVNVDLATLSASLKGCWSGSR